jgi:hypothetical protein
LLELVEQANLSRVDLLTGRGKFEELGAVDFGEIDVTTGLWRPLQTEAVGANGRGIAVAGEGPRVYPLSGFLPDWLELEEGGLGTKACLFLEFASGHVEQWLVRLGLALGNGPGAEIFLAKERTARMDQQNFDRGTTEAKQQEASAHSGHGDAARIDPEAPRPHNKRRLPARVVSIERGDGSRQWRRTRRAGARTLGDVLTLAAMPRRLGLRLSLMFFLDIGVMAAYFPLLSVHLVQTLGFSPREVGVVFAMSPLAMLISPLIVGSLADRVWPAERAAAVVYLLRALALVLASRATSFAEVVGAIFLVGFVSAPSGVLDNTIAFHHLRDKPESIGKSRVFGTVSWIAVLWGTGAYFDELGSAANTRVLFLFAAAIAAVSAVHALTLPHTPPARVPAQVPAHPLAFVGAARMLRRRDFRAVVIATGLSAVCMQVHFVLHPLFYTDELTGLGLDLAATSRASSVAQLLEVGLFPLLGAAIARFGIRRVLVFGLFAWPLRFFAYAWGSPPAFVIGMQTLHGVSVVFGHIGSQVAVDRLAPSDARASSQALLAAISMGAGSLIGQLLCGVLLEACALPRGGYRWPLIFAVPLVLGALATVIVSLGLRGSEPAQAPNLVT